MSNSMLSKKKLSYIHIYVLYCVLFFSQDVSYNIYRDSRNVPTQQDGI